MRLLPKLSTSDGLHKNHHNVTKVLFLIIGLIMLAVATLQIKKAYFKDSDDNHQVNKPKVMAYQSEVEKLAPNKNNTAFIGLVDKSLANDGLVDDDELFIIDIVYKDIMATQQSAEPAKQTQKLFTNADSKNTTQNAKD